MDAFLQHARALPIHHLVISKCCRIGAVLTSPSSRRDQGSIQDQIMCLVVGPYLRNGMCSQKPKCLFLESIRQAAVPAPHSAIGSKKKIQRRKSKEDYQKSRMSSLLIHAKLALHIHQYISPQTTCRKGVSHPNRPKIQFRDPSNPPINPERLAQKRRKGHRKSKPPASLGSIPLSSQRGTPTAPAPLPSRSATRPKAGAEAPGPRA